MNTDAVEAWATTYDYEWYECPSCHGLAIDVILAATVSVRQEARDDESTYRIVSMRDVRLNGHVERLVCRTCGNDADGPSSYWGKGRPVVEMVHTPGMATR